MATSETTRTPDEPEQPLVQAMGAVTITREDLGTELNEQIGFNKREAREFVEAFFNVISQTLAQGEEVHLTGFGNFSLRDKAERPGRNPRTGVAVPVSQRRVVTFHASRKLKQTLQGQDSGAAQPANA